MLARQPGCFYVRHAPRKWQQQQAGRAGGREGGEAGSATRCCMQKCYDVSAALSGSPAGHTRTHTHTRRQSQPTSVASGKLSCLPYLPPPLCSIFYASPSRPSLDTSHVNRAHSGVKMRLSAFSISRKRHKNLHLIASTCCPSAPSVPLQFLLLLLLRFSFALLRCELRVPCSHFCDICSSLRH